MSEELTLKGMVENIRATDDLAEKVFDNLIVLRREMLRTPGMAFFASRLYKNQDPRDQFIATYLADTMATDGTYVFFNPEWVSEQPDAKNKVVLCHEVGHMYAKHPLRRGKRKVSVWQRATDFSMNSVLVKSLPYLRQCNALLDDAYDGMSAEQVYPIELAKYQPPPPPPPGTPPPPAPLALPGDDQGEGNDDDEDDQDGEGGIGLGDGTDNQDHDADDHDTNDADHSAADDTDSDDLGDDGGDTDTDGGDADAQGLGDQDGDEKEDDQYADNPLAQSLMNTQGSGHEGAVIDAIFASELEREKAEQEVTRDVIQAEIFARSIDDMPEEYGSFVGIAKQKQTKTQWLDILREHLEQVFPTDQTFSQPDRRLLYTGMILPGDLKEWDGDLVVAVDGSGSTLDIIKYFVEELDTLINELQIARVHLILFDHWARDPVEFDVGADFLDLQNVGYGGTDFRPIFEKVEEHGLDPAAMVVLTDMECAWFPEQEPDYPVIWAACWHHEGWKSAYSNPPFGNVIDIDVEPVDD